MVLLYAPHPALFVSLAPAHDNRYVGCCTTCGWFGVMHPMLIVWGDAPHAQCVGCDHAISIVLGDEFILLVFFMLLPGKFLIN